MTKYIYATILVALIAVGLWVANLVETVGEQKETIKQKDISIAIKDSQIADSIAQAGTTTEFMKAQEVKNAQDKEFRDCVAARKCGVILRGSSCPKTTDDNPAGSEPAAPRLDENLERNILYLKESIEYNESLMRAKDAFIQKCGAKVGDAK